MAEPARAVVMIVVLATAVVSARALPDGFIDYRAAAERYLACRTDGRALVAAFSPRALRDLTGAVRRLDPESPRAPAPDVWRPGLIAAASVMHTHAALGVRGEERAAQISAARRLLSRIAPSDPEYAVILPWHVTVAALLQGTGDVLAMLDHAERIPEPFRERAPFLLAQAMAYEMVASPLPGPDDRLRIARGKETAPEWIGAQRRAYRDAAIAAFRKVLERESHNAEAGVHLGFLLDADGKTTEAEGVLGLARRHAREPVLRYYVALLSGRLRQRHGDLAGAEREYLAAAEIVPHGQAAAIARAEVVALSGRRVEASVVARELLMRPAGKDAPPADPWLTYPFGQSWKLDALMDELRQAVQSCS